MKSIISFSMIVLLVINSCKKDELVKTTDVRSQLKSAQIVESSNEFCFDLIKTYNTKLNDKNLFISPFSAMEALSMTYNGATGTTKNEMAKVLGFAGYTDDNINDYNKSLTEALLNADNKVKFEVANSIWYREGFDILQSFINVNSSYYNAEVAALDFSNNGALTTINNWVNSKTHEKIPTIIDIIDPDVMMYLINAIYFKGTWQYQFDKSKTKITEFYKEDGSTVEHDQIMLEAELNYYTDDSKSAIMLPYGKGAFNFVIVLPNNNTGSLVDNLNSEAWGEIISSMKKVKVVLKMPKFKFEMKTEMKDYLLALGMSTAFSDSADFSRINNVGGLSISRVIHKTFIELNEEGTEAAAVTAVEIKFTSTGPGENDPVVFNANKPFVYAITEESTGAVLFIGKMMDPTVSQVKD